MCCYFALKFETTIIQAQLNNSTTMKLTNKNKITTEIFAKTVDLNCVEQLSELIENEAYCNEKIRIMPDCHAGKGSVIGFASTFTNKLIPNTVGVDISCGMLVVNLGKCDIDLPVFDELVKREIPSGMEVRAGRYCEFKRMEELYCFRELKEVKRIVRSIGTLGGGNHFIELDKNDAGEIFLVIHSGSRNLGKQVCEYYQQKAVQIAHGKGDYLQQREELIERYKAEGRRNEIAAALESLKSVWLESDIPDDQAWVEGKWMERYIADMKICAEFAHQNRKAIAEILISNYFTDKQLDDFEHFETLHNYIDFEQNLIRKGAVSAKAGERLIIPMNMRDGSLICVGKGNPEWNCSAPHGAGRLMSRAEAFKCLSLDDFRETMADIYTTTANERTLDEAPMAYKPMQEIVECIGETVTIVDTIRPIYNFKAAEDGRFWKKKKS